MIGDVFLFLKDQLNDYLNANSDWSPTESLEETVVLPDGEFMDPMTFKLGAVSALMVNLEEEKTLRPPDPFRRILPDGTSLSVMPEIRVHFHLLFVARYKQYEQGLNYLSLLLRYFQSHRVLDRRNAPALDERIEKLVFELVTLPYAEQNEVWNALRTTYHPSVLYRVKMVVFQDETGLATASELGETKILAEAIA